MAVTTHPWIPENTEWSISTCADEPKCNGQHLTVLTQMETFSSTCMSCSMDLVLDKYPAFFICLDNRFSSAKISVIWGCY
jgi:hypothetical protein